jgi:hypothetical protein
MNLQESCSKHHPTTTRGCLRTVNWNLNGAEISIARDTLQLAPGLAAGGPIRTDVAASEPAMIGASVIRTEVLRGVDGASAPSGEGEESRWRPCRLGAGIGALRTGLAERFVDEPGKGLGLFGACASALGGYEGQLGHGERLVGQPDMDKETDEDESHHEELVKQRVRRHDAHVQGARLNHTIFAEEERPSVVSDCSPL